MTVTINGTTGIAGVDGSAATPAVQGADTNTGIFFPAADTIAFTEGGTEVMRLDSSGNLQFNSGYGSVATAYGCRAWVNFNGTGTVAIRASGNVTSITDNGTGDYTVNFTNALPDANYSATALLDNTASNSGSAMYAATQTGTFATSSIRILSRNAGATGSPSDSASVCVAIFR
jgi:hypothetical protein